MNVNVLTKAQELGDAIANSAELERMKKAEIAQAGDADANLLMTAYNAKYQELISSMQGNEPTAEELQNFRTQMDIELNKLRQNPIILEYMAAREDFEQMMNAVNQTLSTAISGEESSCGGSCSSCSGCH